MWAGASGVKMRILHVGLIRKTSSVLTNDNPTPISILLVYLDLKEKDCYLTYFFFGSE
jgi:hypothetical protein